MCGGWLDRATAFVLGLQFLSCVSWIRAESWSYLFPRLIRPLSECVRQTGTHSPDSPSSSSMTWAMKWSFACTIPSVKKVTKQPVTPTAMPKAIVSPRPTSLRCLFDPFVPCLLLFAAFCLCVCHTYLCSKRTPRKTGGSKRGRCCAGKVGSSLDKT